MITDLLNNKISKEKADIKSVEIEKLKIKGELTKDGIKIDIQSVKKIDGGVEVLARAWRGTKQLGFGKDGSVEIERFKIYNPPILVEDASGGVVREWQREDVITKELVTHTKKFREDPLEALKQDLAHTIAQVGMEDTNIVAGKIGNTTSTFYPDAHVESTTVDGHIMADPASRVTWATLITGLEADARTSPDDSGLVARLFIRKLENDADPWGNLSRIMALFDTSSLPDGDNIDSATISFYGTAKTLVGGGLTPAFTAAIVSSNPASNTALVVGDYADERYGSTDFATRIAYASLVTAAYNNFALNASGLANISKTGVSKFGMRVGSDVDNSEPTGTGDTYYDLQFSMADEAGTSQDPKLVVVHSVPASLPKPLRKSQAVNRASTY